MDQRTKGLLVLLAGVVVLFSGCNPLLREAADDRLARDCPVIGATWSYDRTAATPLLWSCEITWPDGRTETRRAFG